MTYVTYPEIFLRIPLVSKITHFLVQNYAKLYKSLYKNCPVKRIFFYVFSTFNKVLII